jgi:hypothetical protein
MLTIGQAYIGFVSKMHDIVSFRKNVKNWGLFNIPQYDLNNQVVGKLQIGDWVIWDSYGNLCGFHQNKTKAIQNAKNNLKNSARACGPYFIGQKTGYNDDYDNIVEFNFSREAERNERKKMKRVETLDEFKNIWVNNHERELPVWIANPNMWVVWDACGEYICYDKNRIYAIEKAQMIIEEDGLDGAPYFMGKASLPGSLQMINFNDVVDFNTKAEEDASKEDSGVVMKGKRKIGAKIWDAEEMSPKDKEKLEKFQRMAKNERFFTTGNLKHWIIWRWDGKPLALDRDRHHAIEKAAKKISNAEKNIFNQRPFFIGTYKKGYDGIKIIELDSNLRKYQKFSQFDPLIEEDLEVHDILVECKIRLKNYLLTILEEEYVDVLLDKLILDEADAMVAIKCILEQREKEQNKTKFDSLFDELFPKDNHCCMSDKDVFVCQMLIPILLNDEIKYYTDVFFEVVRILWYALGNDQSGRYVDPCDYLFRKQETSFFAQDIKEGIIDNNWVPLRESLEGFSNNDFVDSFMKNLENFDFEMYILHLLNTKHKEAEENKLYEEFCGVGDPIDQCDIIHSYLKRKLEN